ncbi:hypothetical protein WJX77_004494 [Trebouxia sp. C0004]
MVTVQDSLISAGAQSSDLEAILEALENDSIGHSREEEASGPFTELNPAVLGQSPLRLNVKRCNIVKMAIRGAKGTLQLSDKKDGADGELHISERAELVQKPRQRLRPHEALLSSFTAARLKEQQMHFMSDNKTRQKTWREQAGALQALAKLTAQTHPDNAFLLFLEDTDEISVQPPQRRQRRRVVPAFVIASWDSSVVSSKAADRSSSLLCATHSRVMGTAWLQHCLQQAGGTKSSAGFYHRRSCLQLGSEQQRFPPMEWTMMSWTSNRVLMSLYADPEQPLLRTLINHFLLRYVDCLCHL